MGIEGAFTLGSQGLLGGSDAVGWRLAAVRDYGFHGNAFDWMLDPCNVFMVILLSVLFVKLNKMTYLGCFSELILPYESNSKKLHCEVST